MSLNPLYIRNVPDSKVNPDAKLSLVRYFLTPSPQGRYCGQSGYGYVSFERFVRAAKEINEGKASAKDFDDDLPTGRVTEAVTAILEAGRLSLDNRGCKVQLVYNDEKNRIVELKLSSDGK